MIRHLIETQVFGKRPRLEEIPYWLTSRIGFNEVDDWLDDVWSWAERNAYWSHYNRPWSESNYSTMLRSLYPDDLPF